MKFSDLKTNDKKAFIPFITAGDPSLDMTISLISILESAGADIIELGVPFSDPIADGPSIQRSSIRSLENGTSLTNVMNMVSKVRSVSQIPIVLMGYYNPIFKYGVKRFVKDAIELGIDGVVVADLPPEEADDMISSARKHDLSTVFLIAPTSSPERIRLISEVSTGYIYCVSSMGVTGTREKISNTLSQMVKNIRQYTEKPIAVGFGVSNPEQAKEVAQLADGVIVGSAIVNIIEKYKDDHEQLVSAVESFARNLANATHNGAIF